jgi:hypothetical protein
VTSRCRVLRELIRESLYVVDERVVADAIVARTAVRAAVADSSFRSETAGMQDRSIRRDLGARPFRLRAIPHLRRAHQ